VFYCNIFIVKYDTVHIFFLAMTCIKTSMATGVIDDRSSSFGQYFSTFGQTISNNDQALGGQSLFVQ